jgi:capsular exopolysaccharide synthesis family protein
LALEADQQKAKELKDKPEELLNLPAISKQPILTSLAGALATREAEFAMLSQQYKPKHPKYSSAAAELEQLRAALHEKVNAAAGQLSAKWQNAKDYEERLVAEVKEQEKRSIELERKAIDYRVLKREAESNRAMYDAMMARMKELDVTGEIEGGPVKLHETAVTPAIPVRPSKVRFMLTAAALGAALGVGSVAALAKFSPVITTVAHAERHFSLPVLSTIPERPIKDRSGLDYFNSDNHGFAEAFRSLRAALLLADKESEARSMLVTSAMAAEGKTFVCTHLGAALAHAGLRTLIVDADLRKPRVAKAIFGKDSGKGLADFLEGEASLDEIIRPAGPANLYVITAGKRVRHPAELLKQGALRPLIEAAEARFDKVLFDTAPILPVSDTLLLAADIDVACMTVLSGKSRRAAVEQANAALRDAGREPAGIILNRVRKAHHGQRYYYYQSKGYGEEA